MLGKFEKQYGRWSLIALFLGAFLYYHFILAAHRFTFPFPWSDEESYIWPGLSFAKTGSLFSLEMNPDRETFWIPPGLHIIFGILFKIVHFTYERGRLVSEFFTFASIIVFFLYAQKYFNRWIVALFSCLFLFNAPFLMDGNIIRFEALNLFLGVLGFYLHDRGHRLAGFSISALGPLVHPNGCYFVLFQALLILYEAFILKEYGLKNFFKAKWELVFLLFSLSCWTGFVFWSVRNWTLFSTDMLFQLSLKKSLYIPQWRNLRSLTYLLGALLAAFYLIRFSKGYLGVAALLMASATIFRAAQVMWYLNFDCFAYLIVTLIFIETGRRLLMSFSFKKKSLYIQLYQIVSFFILCLIHVRLNNISIPFRPLSSIQWNDMSLNEKWPITSEELEKVGKFIQSLERADRRTIIRMNMSTLFFRDYYSENVFGEVGLFWKGTSDMFIFVHPKSRIDADVQGLGDDFRSSRASYNYIVKNGLFEKYHIYTSPGGNAWFWLPSSLYDKVQ